MAGSREFEYCGFDVETRVLDMGGYWTAAFIFRLNKSKDQTIRMMDGKFQDQDDAHAAALVAASKLIDSILEHGPLRWRQAKNTFLWHCTERCREWPRVDYTESEMPLGRQCEFCHSRALRQRSDALLARSRTLHNRR